MIQALPMLQELFLFQAPSEDSGPERARWHGLVPRRTMGLTDGIRADSGPGVAPTVCPGFALRRSMHRLYARGLRSTRRSTLSLGSDGVVSALSGGDCNTPSHIDYIVMLGVVYK